MVRLWDVKSDFWRDRAAESDELRVWRRKEKAEQEAKRRSIYVSFFFLETTLATSYGNERSEVRNDSVCCSRHLNRGVPSQTTTPTFSSCLFWGCDWKIQTNINTVSVKKTSTNTGLFSPAGVRKECERLLYPGCFDSILAIRWFEVILVTKAWLTQITPKSGEKYSFSTVKRNSSHKSTSFISLRKYLPWKLVY